MQLVRNCVALWRCRWNACQGTLEVRQHGVRDQLRDRMPPHTRAQKQGHVVAILLMVECRATNKSRITSERRRHEVQQGGGDACEQRLWIPDAIDQSPRRVQHPPHLPMIRSGRIQ